MNVRWEDQILVAEFPSTVSDADWAVYIQEVEGAFARDKPFALINYHPAGGAPNAKQRQQAAQGMANYAKTQPNILRASVIVTTSPMVRGAATAVLWLFRPPFPTKVCATLDEGLRFARQQLSEPAPAG